MTRSRSQASPARDAKRVPPKPPAPRRRRVSHAEAARKLATQDPVIARLLDEVGPPRLRRPQESALRRLGHSSIQVTLDTYGHLFPELEEDVTQRLDAVGRAAHALRAS